MTQLDAIIARLEGNSGTPKWLLAALRELDDPAPAESPSALPPSELSYTGNGFNNLTYKDALAGNIYIAAVAAEAASLANATPDDRAQRLRLLRTIAHDGASAMYKQETDV